MTPRVETRPAAHLPARIGRSSVTRTVAVAALALALVQAVSSAAFDDERFVERITFQNDSDFDVHVTVGDERGRWLGLGFTAQHCSTTFHLVIDQGHSWRLRFRAQGRFGGEHAIDRSQLEADGWTYRIPDSVAEQLTSAGAPAPPRQQCPNPREQAAP